MHLNQDKQQQDISHTNGDSMLMPDSSAHIARLGNFEFFVLFVN
jgi:hypothetical protein